MKFVSRYQSHPVDSHQCVHYPNEDNETWAYLYERQMTLLQGRAINAYIEGLEKLALPKTHIPQIPEVNKTLKLYSDWSLAPVEAVISSARFFELLSQKHFPVATFIRRREDIDYITEPDVFHEIYGHVPLLTNPFYAGFIEQYAKIALTYPKEDWNLFLRLFWFTIEFGLVQTEDGMRIYGGGILSSYGETMTCLDTYLSYHVYMNPITALRTPFRIDMIQPIYFVIPHLNYLQSLLELDFSKAFKEVRQSGLFYPLFPKPEQEINPERY